MTTITHEQLQAILQAPCTDTRNAALADAGITIAPPAQPEAMVRLAREIVISQFPKDAARINKGEWDYDGAMQCAISALQFADKVVREADDWSANGTLIERNAIRRKLGAIA